MVKLDKNFYMKINNVFNNVEYFKYHLKKRIKYFKRFIGSECVVIWKAILNNDNRMNLNI